MLCNACTHCVFHTRTTTSTSSSTSESQQPAHPSLYLGDLHARGVAEAPHALPRLGPRVVPPPALRATACDSDKQECDVMSKVGATTLCACGCQCMKIQRGSSVHLIKAHSSSSGVVFSQGGSASSEGRMRCVIASRNARAYARATEPQQVRAAMHAHVHMGYRS
jgi:hypothetical protein